MSETLWRIKGAGPVGLACALFLLRRGIPASAIALDPPPVANEPIDPGLAARVLAVSHADRWASLGLLRYALFDGLCMAHEQFLAFFDSFDF